MDYFQLEHKILEKLRNESDRRYHYHNVNHTIDVIRSAEEIALFEKLSIHDSLILKTAALMHDIGFLKQYEDNEDISVQMSREILPEFGYTQSEIEQICNMILMTAYPARPVDYLEMLLCDADLDYLGTETYFDKSMNLFKEWREMGKVSSLKQWYEMQIVFLSAHTFHSEYAIQNRLLKKNEVLSLIKQLLGQE